MRAQTRKSSRAKGASVYRVLKCLSSTELRGFRGLDLDRFAGFRIATGAGGAQAGVEGAETDQGYFLALAQARLHRVDERVDRALGGRFGNLGRLSDLLDQVGFVHDLMCGDGAGLVVGLGRD